MKKTILLAALGVFPLGGRVFADVSPVTANPIYTEAMVEVTKYDRDDPEVKAAVAALRATDVANRGKPAESVDSLELEEAQLKVEQVLVRKAKLRRPAAKGLMEKRQQEIEVRLSNLGTKRLQRSAAKGVGQQ